ncbi:5-methyltetrahydrofolate--homocysteine methyltransferase [Candidatus Hakubella thermalkaliphila]|uniref:5-methyltetrahydrofolate--homocysteine methyltransferase n=1 Tax=Candidatus Hakubella thermalkaliphila TaxID=2754717 RepID=A0A6V8QEU2_9ACTN|nr:5-methyltetrahydrofolate--homocysteine methyltransferase [Candidatus Hakubella thermalkaliphila]GFP42564.1 5-methyltetrahydrofolate--homocysteine methyltransferase [Candidatus Hakubella thermalkaliphila]
MDADRFVEAVKTEAAGIVAMSALLTITMYGMKETIEVLKEAGLRDRVKIMVGELQLRRILPGTSGLMPMPIMWPVP